MYLWNAGGVLGETLQPRFRGGLGKPRRRPHAYPGELIPFLSSPVSLEPPQCHNRASFIKPKQGARLDVPRYSPHCSEHVWEAGSTYSPFRRGSRGLGWLYQFLHQAAELNPDR